MAALRMQNDLDGNAASVTAVCAPVGSGKTTLVAAAARRQPAGTVAWCTLDDDDNDPHEFGLSMLEAVLAAGSSDGVRRATSAGRSVADALDEAMLIATYSEIGVLVLDDCEHVGSRSMQPTIGRLIRQAPPGFSVVLLSKQDLILPPRAGKAAPVRQMRTADLVFSADEVRQMLARRHASVSEEVLEALMQWTGGVPGAVALAAACYRDAGERAPIVTSDLAVDNNAHVVLFEQITDWLPPTQRALLLLSSLADPVSADLLARLSGVADASAHIAEIARMNLFLDAVPGCPGWYRHRHPSRELLTAALLHERAEDLQVLHRGAARWFAVNGFRNQALESALNGHDWEIVVELARTQWIQAAFDELDPGFERIGAVPAEQAARCTASALVACAVDVEHGDLVRARQRLDESVTAIQDEQLDYDTQVFEPLLRLRLARDAADAPAIVNASCVLLERGSCDPVANTEDLALLIRRALAEARLIEGDLAGAFGLLEQVYDDGSVKGRESQVAEATAALAVVAALSGRIRRATAFIEELGEPWCSRAAFCRGVRALALAICEYHADNIPAAQAAAAEARAALRPGVHRDVILASVRARLATTVGDRASAHRHLMSAAANATPALLATMRDALGLPGHALDAGGPGGHPYTRALTCLAASVHAYEARDYEESWTSLELALALVERHGFRRLILDSGLQVRDPLRDYIAQVRPFGQTAWQLLQRLPSERSTDSAPVVEALSERELAVLRYLPTMKSNREIADEMHFSVNTVKTHLKSIYRKLAVNRRRAAVEEAKARSLL
jgi:LuxR family maltose regulon positive regulatory protein